MTVLTKIFGDPNAREVARGLRTVEQINSFEPDMERVSDDELASVTTRFRQRVEEALASVAPVG